MLVTDGDAHQRLRGAAHDVFTPDYIAGLRAGVDAIAEAAINRLPTGEVFDFVSEVARPLPLAVIGEWLGVDAETSRLLRERAPTVIQMLLPLATAEQVTDATRASVTLVAHFLPLASSRRDNPGEDLLSFIASDPDLLLEEAVMIAVHIAIAGFETIASLLGAAAVRLLTPGADGTRFVDVLDVSDPSLITELLRLDGPAQAIPRTATRSQRIGGVEVAPGEQIVIVLAAANRDPAVFDEPDQLRLDRRGPAPLTFGHGPHHCLGAALARLEVEVALRRMLARHPVLMGPVTWLASPAIRGPRKLPMTFHAAGEAHD
jgi:cytochrome P450